MEIFSNVSKIRRGDGIAAVSFLSNPPLYVNKLKRRWRKAIVMGSQADWNCNKLGIASNIIANAWYGQAVAIKKWAHFVLTIEMRGGAILKHPTNFGGAAAKASARIMLLMSGININWLHSAILFK